MEPPAQPPAAAPSGQSPLGPPGHSAHLCLSSSVVHTHVPMHTCRVHTYTRVYLPKHSEDCNSTCASDSTNTGPSERPFHAAYVYSGARALLGQSLALVFLRLTIYTHMCTRAHSPGRRRWPCPPPSALGRPGCGGNVRAANRHRVAAVVTQEGALGVGQVRPQPSRSPHRPPSLGDPPVNKDEVFCLPNSQGCVRG